MASAGRARAANPGGDWNLATTGPVFNHRCSWTPAILVPSDVDVAVFGVLA